VVAKAVEPKPEPKPVVAKAVEPKPEPKPVVAKAVEPKPEPKSVVAKAVEPKPEPKPEPAAAPVAPDRSVGEVGMIDSAPVARATEPSPDSATDDNAALRASIPGAHKRSGPKSPADPTAASPADAIAGTEPTDERIADAAGADAAAPQAASKRAAAPSTDPKRDRAPSPSDVTRRIEGPRSADSGLPFDLVTLAGIAVGALIVLVVAVRVFRRRSLPHDLDVTAFADMPDADTGRAPSDRMRGAESSMNDFPTDRTAAVVEEQNTAAYSLSEVAAETMEPETGVYDEDSEGEKPMDMETSNLPTQRSNFGASPAAARVGGDTNLSQLVQELAGRIANLETRLDEANDSRERLERQVAAQSEELRVQRAAIARTQRALRSLSRSEEDQATEPALREPSQPVG